jgi:hypothetical protein
MNTGVEKRLWAMPCPVRGAGMGEPGGYTGQSIERRVTFPAVTPIGLMVGRLTVRRGKLS